MILDRIGHLETEEKVLEKVDFLREGKKGCLLRLKSTASCWWKTTGCSSSPMSEKRELFRALFSSPLFHKTQETEHSKTREEEETRKKISMNFVFASFFTKTQKNKYKPKQKRWLEINILKVLHFSLSLFLYQK